MNTTSPALSPASASSAWPFRWRAQDTASNFIGGVVIVADKPFAVGDWIQTSSLEGVVEDISLRSTRIRTFKDALVVVSNSSLAADEIINWSRMNKRRVEMTLGFTYQTSRETLGKVVEGIRELLKSDENVVGDPTVAFNEFGESSLNVTVSYFLNQTGYADYIRLKEQLNFQIMDLCESLGADFAFPSPDGLPGRREIVKTVVGRFAPTPSGKMHLGNVLCCLVAWLSARSQGGKVLLRGGRP